jgi:hypothetical protein
MDGYACSERRVRLADQRLVIGRVGLAGRPLAEIALYALVRASFDRRFLREVITLAIGLAAAKNILQEGVLESFKGLSAWTEHNYLREKRAELHTAEQKAAGKVRAEAAHQPRRQ